LFVQPLIRNLPPSQHIIFFYFYDVL